MLVIWKLDRMGRAFKHLVELVGNLIERKVGLLSLSDPIDTTNVQGRLVFNLFASLAEFERKLVRERTQAGLSAARARGRVGGRPKGFSPQVQATAMAAETLYRERRMGVAAIALNLHVSKSTPYSYLRHRGVEIGPYEKIARQRLVPTVVASSKATEPKIATILLTLRIENNSKFVRGKKRTLEHTECLHLDNYDAKRQLNGDYEPKIPYDSEEDLDNTVNELLSDIVCIADDRHCFSVSNTRMKGTDRHW